MTTLNTKIFPINPFPDVQPSDFNKLNKKHVSEDYVGENFKLINWEVFLPFNDTGIDRIISKYICPNNHTKYNENLNNLPCPTCNSPSIKIFRFLQIKTRELKGEQADTFGFTLTPEDFRTDPRHIFLFYSDHTNDFIMLSVSNYLDFFEANNRADFSKPTFRQGNGKLNDLKYDAVTKNWLFKGVDWKDYVNIAGIENMQNSYYDLNLDWYISHIDSVKRKLFYQFSGGNTFNQHIEIGINNYITQIQTNQKTYFTNLKSANLGKLNSLDATLKKSIGGYYNKFKGLKLT